MTQRVWNYDLNLGSPFFSQALERYVQAESLRELGRDQDALQWYETVDQVNTVDIVYSAPSHVRRAEIYERLGDREKALRHYALFIKLWQECDPELRPMVDEARRRLNALQAKVPAETRVR